MKRLGLITAVSIGIAAAVFAQAGQRGATTPAAVAQGDWQNINRDPGASRFSPLTQINVGNVAKLQVGDPQRVLDGDLDPFIKTYLMKKASGTLDTAAPADEE